MLHPGISITVFIFSSIIIRVFAHKDQKCGYIDHMSNKTHFDLDFHNFARRFNKSYIQNATEYEIRKQNFKASVVRQCGLNMARGHQRSAAYGVNQYSDLTPTEFAAQYLRPAPTEQPAITKSMNEVDILAEWFQRMKKSHPKDHWDGVMNSKHDRIYMLETVPRKWDWREHNVVTPVRNQKQCGACWAFSSVECIESKRAMIVGQQHEPPLALSVQQAIDCATGGSYGCKGGDTCGTLRWMNTSKIRLVPESVYPLTDVADRCQRKNSSVFVTVSDYKCNNVVGRGEAVTMCTLLYGEGPVSVTVDASTWQDYLGGIIQYHCGGGTHYNNHAVTLVAYDLTGDIPYYVAKNSWGSQFGLDGYVKIQAGKNVCGVAEEVSTVDVQPN